MFRRDPKFSDPRVSATLANLAIAALRRAGMSSRESDKRLRGGAFLSRKLLSGARVKGMVFHSLDAEDGGDAEDFMGVGAAGNIGGGAVQAKQDLAVSIGPGDVPHEFAGDVARIEIGENQDVGVADDDPAR
jgi:hypothetical protein